MSTPPYNPTVAKIAGSLLSGIFAKRDIYTWELKKAVETARDIIAETQRTEPLKAKR